MLEQGSKGCKSEFIVPVQYSKQKTARINLMQVNSFFLSSFIALLATLKTEIDLFLLQQVA